MLIHQPDQAIFRSARPEDLDSEAIPSVPAVGAPGDPVGVPSEPGPYVIRVMVPRGVKKLRPPRMIFGGSGLTRSCPVSFTSGWGAGLTANSWRHSRQARSSCSLAVPLISIGRVSRATNITPGSCCWAARPRRPWTWPMTGKQMRIWRGPVDDAGEGRALVSVMNDHLVMTWSPISGAGEVRFPRNSSRNVTRWGMIHVIRYQTRCQIPLLCPAASH